MRCFARYCYDRGLTTKTELAVQTGAGTIRPKLLLDEAGAVTAVRVDMGAPRFKAAEIPVVTADREAEAMDEVLTLDSGEQFEGACISVGNPHLTIWVDDVDAFELERIGPLLERHERFPRRINVHIVQRVGSDELKMRTWERGSGITLACGTGAAAVHVTAVRQGVMGRASTIHLPGGALQLEWDPATNHVFKTGPARFICDGTWLG
ncbi:MAG TPA: diaminopimelate epimerase, partial [Symbiobacteriaceae bacterium]|nr:diaminopimelate epimerase [Symbiobacteriaceae bacterium]